MQLFKTEVSIPQTFRAFSRPRFHGAAIRYGHARLRNVAGAAAVHTAAAPTLVELPRVQAVVDAIMVARAA